MTAQAPEILIYQAKRLELCSEPLSQFPGVFPVERPYIPQSSANRRGYLGIWIIESDRLYLKSMKRLKLVNGKPEFVGIEDLFPGYPDGVFAHWYTGHLRCPRGALLNYIHGGYSSTYEEDLILQVQRGVVIQERIVRHGNAANGSTPGYLIRASTSFGEDD